MINATEFSREFTAAVRKLNEAIITFNKLAGYTNWKEVKCLIDKAKEEVDFIIDEKPHLIVDVNKMVNNEPFISMEEFVNTFHGRFSINAIITRLKEDQTFFNKCGRKNEQNLYEIKKVAAIKYLSTRNGPIPFRIRKFIEEERLKGDACQ